MVEENNELEEESLNLPKRKPGRPKGTTKKKSFSQRLFKRGARKEQRRIESTTRSGIKSLFGSKAYGGKRKVGRPKKSYKYGMPIQQYKKLQSLKRAQYEQYKMQRLMELQGKGIAPDEARQLQLLRAVRSNGMDTTQNPIGVLETPESVMSGIDDDLNFTKWRADKMISPNTQKILRNLRYNQLRSIRDDIEQQRRLKERRMISNASDLLKAPFIFNRYQFDMTGLAEGDKMILAAPNIFKAREDNRIMRTGRPNILQSRESGNLLNFFGQRRE